MVTNVNSRGQLGGESEVRVDHPPQVDQRYLEVERILKSLFQHHSSKASILHVHCFPVIIVWGSVQLSMPGRLAGLPTALSWGHKRKIEHSRQRQWRRPLREQTQR